MQDVDDAYDHLRCEGAPLMQRFLAPLALVLALLVAVAPVHQPSAGGAATRDVPLYRGIMPALKHVQIPVKLPATLPGDLIKKGQHVYAYLVDVSSWSYIVTIDYTRDCHGADACSLAEIDGGPTLNEPTILDYPWGKPVTLARHVRGLFRPFSCGASCGQSAVVFADPATGIIYMAAIHGGSEKDTLALANAMLAP
jgi:hypothetical protein